MQESCKQTWLSRWLVPYKPAGPHLRPHFWGNAVRGRRQAVEFSLAEWCSKARIQQLSTSEAPVLLDLSRKGLFAFLA